MKRAEISMGKRRRRFGGFQPTYLVVLALCGVLPCIVVFSWSRASQTTVSQSLVLLNDERIVNARTEIGEVDGKRDTSSQFYSLPIEKSPLQQLEVFLRENPAAPATEFVGLLRHYLHFEPGAEVERTKTCGLKDFNISPCIAGLRNYRMAADKIRELYKQDEGLVIRTLNNHTKMAQQTKLALWENDPLADDPTKFTAYGVLKYRDTDHDIPRVGTSPECLPLMLAGSVVRDPESVVVELGPFAGLSSTCIVTGMLKNGLREHAFHAFDTFVGPQNYRAISRSDWVLEKYPQYTTTNSSFLQLWKDTVQYVYPLAEATAGLITHHTLTPSTLHNKKMALLSINTSKSASQLKTQLGGLTTIEKGTIIFFMEFEFVRQTIKQVYGCLREQFLLPVYVSWTHGHWAFIVMNNFSFNDPNLKTCYGDLNRDRIAMLPRLMKLVDDDLRYLSGLTEDPKVTAQFTEIRSKVATTIKSKLMMSPADWNTLVSIYT